MLLPVRGTHDSVVGVCAVFVCVCHFLLCVCVFLYWCMCVRDKECKSIDIIG